MFKIGIVGAGIIAVQHKDAIVKHPKAELAAVCDIDISKAEKCAEGTNAAVYADFKEMADKESLDAVIINLPHFLHRDAAVYFLERGINTLCEKPMAINTRECGEMKAAAEKGGSKLVIGHMQRYQPAHRELKKIIDEKRLGELCLVTETRNIDYFHNRPAWFLDKKKAGGGIVMNYCAHTLDKIFYLLGTEVKSVRANVANKINGENIEAQAQVLLELGNSVSAAFSYCASRINYSYETIFYFSDGVAKIENANILYTAKKDEQFVKAELDYDTSPMEVQFGEFVKLLGGEKADVSDADYGEKIISVIEKILE